ncbi:MAG: hypothetical protein AB7T14_04285 [Candidatus Methylacidiphilaceae bacterium]
MPILNKNLARGIPLVIDSPQMKATILLATLMMTVTTSSYAILTEWHPAKEPYQYGPRGTGKYSLVWNMRRYATPPNRPYLIIGSIGASGGIFGSPRTRAVEVARDHGADAILWTKADVHPEVNSIGLIGLLSHCDYLAIRWANPSRLPADQREKRRMTGEKKSPAP